VPLGFHSGREADHSPPSSAEVKEWVELYLHSPNTPSCCGAQLGGAQGQLYLYLKEPYRCDHRSLLHYKTDYSRIATKRFTERNGRRGR
jgi:hypothetical protein